MTEQNPALRAPINQSEDAAKQNLSAAEEARATLSGERTTGAITGGVVAHRNLAGENTVGVANAGAVGTDAAYAGAVAASEVQQGLNEQA